MITKQETEKEMPSETRPIQLGLCCLNTELRDRKPSVFASRTVILKTLADKGVDFLKEKILQNLRDVLTIMDWNEENGIKVYRLSSEMFPHKSNPKAADYTFDFAKDLLKQIGKKAKLYNQRLTFHPGQFNVLGSPHENVLLKTITGLDYHASVLDLMGMDQNSVMVIHGGGTYGNKPETIKRWCRNYNTLPIHIKRRLVLENCERCFSVADCLEISKHTGVPVIFDTHHYTCYNILHPDETLNPPEYYIPDILEAFKRRQIKPKFHISEQGSGKVGHHSDYVEVIPDYLLEIPEKYNTHIDIMIEAKMKEKSIKHLYEKYPFLDCKITVK